VKGLRAAGRSARSMPALFILAAHLLIAAAPAAAQLASPQSHVSAALPPDHWAITAVNRAEALGLLRGYLPAQRAVPRHVIARALQEAGARARDERPELVRLTSAWLDRFAEEFRETAGAGGTPLTLRGNALGIGYDAQAGRAAVGLGVFPETRTGAAAMADASELRVGAMLNAEVGAHAAVLLEPRLLGADFSLRSWDVVAGWRPWSVSIGRSAVGYGYGRFGSGVVLSGVVPLNRVQIETVRPVRLPGALSHLGAIALHTYLSKLEEPRHPGDPYFWGIAGSLQPHPRVTLAIHRASIFGGDSVSTPVTPRNLLRTFVGHNLLGFENEVVAAHLRLRLPTERVLPVTLYGEWGAEDAAGAWRDVPGRVAGLLVPALPGLPVFSLGAEYAGFGGSCCGNPPWYRHAPHAGGWADQDLPLGHALGGHGTQLMVYSGAELLRATVRLDAELFQRERREENLFVPGREGRSRGGAGTVHWRLLPRAELRLGGSYEAGTGWREHVFTMGANAFF
jgi:hypothetical protein